MPEKIHTPVAEPEKMPLVNLEAIQRLADHYGKNTMLPRVVGRNYDLLDDNGNMLPVGKLIVLKKFADQLNTLLESVLQERFQETAYRIAESLNGDSGGLVDDKFRVVCGFPGSLKVDRIDRAA